MKKRTLALLVVVFSLCWTCFSGVSRAEYVTKTIDSNGTWTDELYCPKGDSVAISITPDTSPVMTITLQWRLPGEATWGSHNVDEWILTATSKHQEYITEPAPEYLHYRLGCNVVADYTSGNCTGRLGRDNY